MSLMPASLGAFFAHPTRLDRDDVRTAFADLAVLGTGAAVVTLFAVSEVTLEHFEVHYIDPGGSPLAKFHPATFLAVAAFGLRCLSSRHPWQHGWRILGRSPGSATMLAAAVVAMVFATLIAKIPITPLVDTFALPVLLFLLLRDLDRKIVTWLALLVTAILCVNAVMAILEFARGMHFITLDVPAGASSDPTRGDVVFDWRVQLAQEWRAIALLGHPLVNGLVVGGVIICLAAPGARWLPWAFKAPCLLLQLAAMFAFGARSSLVLGVVFAAGLILQQLLDGLRRGARLSPRTVAIVLIGLALCIGAGALLASTGFFDRTIERFANDEGSATARYKMLELFGPLSWTDLVFGPDPNVVATWQRVHGLEFGIESAWVGLILTYGLVITAIILIGLLAFSRAIVSASGRGAALVLVYYFLSVSGTASLSGKTTTFSMTAVLVLLFLRKDERSLRTSLALGPGVFT